MDRLKLLVIDDDPKTVKSLGRILDNIRPLWTLTWADGVRTGIKLFRENNYDAILLDIRMPVEDGFKFLEITSQEIARTFTPLIIETGSLEKGWKAKALRLGASDLIEKPFDIDETVQVVESLVERSRNHRSLFEQAEGLRELAENKNRELEASKFSFLIRLAQACEVRDQTTGHHVVRVANLSTFIGKVVGFSEEHLTSFYAASALHDIGKLGIPDSILLKQGPLSTEERMTMELHCQIGADLLSKSHSLELVESIIGHQFPSQFQEDSTLQMARAVALNHHESWDGSGYPNGFAARDIPIEARVVCVADVLDALTSDRPYRKAWSFQQGLAFLSERSGKQFDPAVVQICQDNQSKIFELLESPTLYSKETVVAA